MVNYFLVCLLGLLAVHCSHKEVNPNDPEALYQDAEESFTDSRYLGAIEKYRDLKNRFPYSSRAIDAELRIADAYFEQESFIEAASGYEIFQELHPSHPKSDYVQYKTGLSYYNQVPSSSARDLSAGHKTLDVFFRFLQKYPNSEYAAKAKECISDARKKLAEHDNDVANFYFQKQHYLSASYRYAALLREFPGSSYEEESLFRLGQSYSYIRMIENAMDALRQLLQKFPKSAHATEAQSLLDELSPKN